MPRPGPAREPPGPRPGTIPGAPRRGTGYGLATRGRRVATRYDPYAASLPGFSVPEGDPDLVEFKSQHYLV